MKDNIFLYDEFYFADVFDWCHEELFGFLKLSVYPYGNRSQQGMIGIYDGSFSECYLVDIHEKVEFGVPISPHVSVEEVDVCIIQFFYVF